MLVRGYLLLQSGTHEAAAAALERARATYVAVDAASWPLVEAFGADRFFEATAGANVVLANEREAWTLTGREADAAARALAERYAVVALKLGARGAILVVEGEVSAREAELIFEVDPTGAGDAFDGVLLAGLARGDEPQAVHRRAGHAGALVAAARELVAAEPTGAVTASCARSASARRSATRLEAGRGVVALETSVIGQGLPHPRNEECVRRMSGAIRTAGRRAGVDRRRSTGGRRGPRRPPSSARSPTPAAARRRWRAGTCRWRWPGGRSAPPPSRATIWAAARAGVEVGATGGIGGVHPGGDRPGST